MLNIRYFARLREVLGCGEEALMLPAGVVDIGTLRAHLAGRGARWSESLTPGTGVRAAVNQQMADDAVPIKDGDEIAFFPPVTGG